MSCPNRCTGVALFLPMLCCLLVGFSACGGHRDQADGVTGSAPNIEDTGQVGLQLPADGAQRRDATVKSDTEAGSDARQELDSAQTLNRDAEPDGSGPADSSLVDGMSGVPDLLVRYPDVSVSWDALEDDVTLNDPDDAESPGPDAAPIADASITSETDATLPPETRLGVCTPAVTECDGANRRVCRADGSGWEVVGCLCGCANGVCRAAECVAEQMRCLAGQAQTCGQDGCGWVTQSDCALGCDAQGQRCLTCTSNERKCVGTDQHTCNGDGTAWVSAPCALGCNATVGSCNLCKPGDTRCNDDSSQQTCGLDGKWASAVACDHGCAVSFGKAVCRLCEAGTARCGEKEWLQRCTADGLYWQSELACKAGCNTARGECNLCFPGSKSCHDDAIQVCNADGEAWTATTTCEHGCRSDIAECRVCTEGATRCDGNMLQICGSIGHAWTGEANCVAGCLTTKTGAVCVDAGRFAMVANGDSHSCAILEDSGDIWCWGFNRDGRLGLSQAGQLWGGSDVAKPRRIASLGGGWKHLAAAGSRTCAIGKDDTLWCWSGNLWYTDIIDYTPGPTRTDVPVQFGTETWRTISLSYNHSCGIRQDRTLRCWGDNSNGQLGNGSTESSELPVVPGADPQQQWLAVSAGGNFSCAIKQLQDGVGGPLYCWGRRDVRIDFVATETTSPTLIGAESDRWTSVAVGATYVCGIKSDKRLWCWGSNIFGAVTDGALSQGSYHGPVQVGDGAWLSVEVSAARLCGRRLGADGNSVELVCWGSWNWGENAPAPFVSVHADASWRQLSVGYDHACAIREDHSLWCWGSTLYGQVGAGRLGYQPLPTKVSHTHPWSTLSGRCAIDSNKKLYCWAFPYPNQPTQIDASDWIAVSSADGTRCGIRSDRSMWCWGNNSKGSLGVGPGVQFNEIPQRVTATADDQWVAVVTSGSHTCALQQDQSLWCWGENGDGQVGDASQTRRFLPTAVAPETKWAKVAVGLQRTFALDSAGHLWAWGAYSSFGKSSTPVQLGDQLWHDVGSGPYATCALTDAGALSCWEKVLISPPVQLEYPGMALFGNINWSALSRACALTSDGVLHCQGKNFWGENGDGTLKASGLVFASTVFSNPPQSWRATSAIWGATGLQANCAIDSDGTLYCWGRNSEGQLGLGFDAYMRSLTQVTVAP